MIDYQEVISIILKASGFFFNEEALGQTIEKGVMDYTTAVDLNVENYVEEELKKLAPGVQFLSEEKELQGDIDIMKPTWILDPVDGTNNLMFHFQLSTISLAYYDEGVAQFGAVYNPYSRELFTAIRGKGAYMNGRKIRVNDVPDLQHGVVSFGLNQCYREYTDQMFRTIRNIFDKSMDMRRLGTSSLDLAYVACGRASAFFETILLPWDYAAGLLLVEEAGGKVTAMDGSPVKVPENSSIVATNGLVHNEILEIINDGNDFIR